MSLSSSAPVAPVRRPPLAAVCLVLLVGWAALGLHPLLHHADHPADPTCAVCVQLAANPAVPVAAIDLPADRPLPLTAAARAADTSAPAVAATRSRAPPSALPVP